MGFICQTLLVLAGAGFACAAAGCSLVTVQQDPFPPLEIRADRPAPPPARVVLTDSDIQILDKVQFETGSDKLLPVSFPLLDAVAGVMVENEQIELVEIQGHTDATGSAAINRKLSAARAESVKKYLGDKGVAKTRLSTKGFGPDVPIADNQTAAGRDANRRVEFKIIKQGPKKTLVQED
jgi:OmpA-OmpF porin, OOP family